MKVASRQVTGESKVTEPIRPRGHRGGVITLHRAFAHYHRSPGTLFTSLCLFLFFSSIWVVLLPSLCRFLKWSLALGLRFLPLHATLASVDHEFRSFRLQMPGLQMEPTLPDFGIWSVSCAATLLLFAATFFLPKRFLAIAYFLRTILTVHATALVYFLIWPSRFPHTPNSYLDALLNSGIGIITIVPLLFALVYYIFDFGLLRKALLTALTMTYLSLFLPFQILLQALVLQKSVLFMPLLYIIFGMPLQVLLIIAFYSWGMTWPIRLPAEETRQSREPMVAR